MGHLGTLTGVGWAVNVGANDGVCGVDGSPGRAVFDAVQVNTLKLWKAARRRLPNRLTLRRFPFDGPIHCTHRTSPHGPHMVAPAPIGQWETSKAVIGAADDTDSTERTMRRRTDKHRMLFNKL